MPCPTCNNTVTPGKYCPECGLAASSVADDFARYLEGVTWGVTTAEIFADDEPAWAGLALTRVSNMILERAMKAGRLSDDLRAVINAINSARLGEDPDDGA